MYCCRRRNKRHSIENYREVSDVKDLPDFRAGVLYTSAIPRTWCARPRVRSEESLCRRGWGFGFGRAGTPPGFLKLSPSPVFLVWSRGGRKNVSLLIVTAQAFSSSSVKNRWNALNNKLPNFFFFFFNLSVRKGALWSFLSPTWNAMKVSDLTCPWGPWRMLYAAPSACFRFSPRVKFWSDDKWIWRKCFKSCERNVTC